MLVLAGTLSSCASTGILATASGSPEVVIPRTDLQTVADACANWSISNGFKIEVVTPYSVEATRGSDFTLASGFFIPGPEQVDFGYAPIVDSSVHLVAELHDFRRDYGTQEEKDYMQSQLHVLDSTLERHRN